MHLRRTRSVNPPTRIRTGVRSVSAASWRLWLNRQQQSTRTEPSSTRRRAIQRQIAGHELTLAEHIANRDAWAEREKQLSAATTRAKTNAMIFAGPLRQNQEGCEDAATCIVWRQ